MSAAPQPVDPNQRFVAGHPCPICGGHKDLEQHQGVRCYGYLSGDERSAICTRAESNRRVPEADGWRHPLRGSASDDDGLDWIEVELARQEQQRDEIKTYIYRDASGGVIRRKFRFPDGAKRWDSAKGVKVTVPYRLPELVAAAGAQVFVVDGEKDVEALRAVGATATCAPNGLSSWDEQFGGFLAPMAKVTIVRDKDDAGHSQAVRVKATIPAGVEVEIVEAAFGKDAHDHLDAGHGLDEFVRVPTRFQTIDLSTYEPVEIDWLYEPILLGRAHTAINAGTGSGNTMLALILMLAVVRDGETVAYLDQENGPDVIRPRMEALGYTAAEMAQVVYFPYPGAGQDELAALAAEITHLSPVLVVLDPMVNFYSAADYDEDSSKDTTRFHTEFVVPVKRSGAAVLEFDHLGHSGKRARGSSAKAGHAEAEWTFSVAERFDRDTTTIATLTRGVKNRYARLPPELTYRMGGDGNDGFIFERQYGDQIDPSVRKWKDILATTEAVLKASDRALGVTSIAEELRAADHKFDQAVIGKKLNSWADGASSRIKRDGRKFTYPVKEERTDEQR